MFKASALRQVRLCRITGANAGSALASLRTTLRSTQTSSALHTTAAISYNGIARNLRQYSHAAAERTSPAAHSQEPPRKLSKFSELGDLGVHDRVVSAITRGMKYEDMTDVQSATIHAALAGKDLVAQAKTGTGKTLAFLVPLVQRIIVDDEKLAHPRQVRARSDDIRAIIVSPTRELAEQIGQEARRLCRGTGVIVQTAVGGTQKASMLRKTRTEGCHLLVATPGRLYDLLNDPTSGIDAPNLSALVLDEADRMLDVGFDEELRNIVRLLPDRNETPRQTMLFSATIPKDVVQLARTYVNANNFEFVQTIKADDVPTHEKVPQFIVPVKGFENVFPTLLELINKELAAAKESHDVHPFKAIVFLPTAAMVRLAAGIFGRIQRRERSKYPPVLEIHSRLTQRARTQAADEFRTSRSAILFSTDVTARGMDFPNVTHVIQCFNPSDREHYIHRIGRTGRAGKSGQAWLIVPELEVDGARNLLPGLPIQRATGFDSANYHLARQDAVNQPETFEPVFSVMQRLPDFLLEEAYLGAFGRLGHIRAQELVDALNDWVRYGWGWEQPPAIPRKLASQRGLSRVRGIRIQDDEPRPPRRDAQFPSRDNRDNRISRRSPSNDPFDAVQENFQDRPRRSQRPRASF